MDRYTIRNIAILLCRILTIAVEIAALVLFLVVPRFTSSPVPIVIGFACLFLGFIFYLFGGEKYYHPDWYDD